MMSDISHWLINDQILLDSGLEAKYKFSTDIFLLEYTDWALQSFSLRQAICAIFSSPVFYVT